MANNLNDNASCRTCGYDLRGQTQPRCPECGRHFDPQDPTTYAFRPQRIPIGLGFALSGIHLAVTFVLLLYVLADGLGPPDDLTVPPPSPLAESAGMLLKVLMQPLVSLWNKWMSQHVPNLVEILLFLLNSCVWGFPIAILWDRLRRRLRRPQRPRTR